MRCVVAVRTLVLAVAALAGLLAATVHDVSRGIGGVVASRQCHPGLHGGRHRDQRGGGECHFGPASVERLDHRLAGDLPPEVGLDRRAGDTAQEPQLLQIGSLPYLTSPELCECGLREHEIMAREVVINTLFGVQLWLVVGALVLAAPGVWQRVFTQR